MSKVYVGDIGVDITVDCLEDLSGASAYALSVLKPNGEVESWAADIAGTALRYITASGDLDVAGVYKLQPVLTLTPWSGRGETVQFEVFAAHR